METGLSQIGDEQVREFALLYATYPYPILRFGTQVILVPVLAGDYTSVAPGAPRLVKIITVLYRLPLKVLPLILPVPIK